MSTELAWNGIGLKSRSFTVTLPGPVPAALAEMMLPTVLPPRVIRITLAPGQRFPAKRGTPVVMSFTFDGRKHRIEGRVKFRRLNAGVIDGQVHRVEAVD